MAKAEKSLIVEREEVMVSEKGHSFRKTHFLNPFVTSIDHSSVAELPRQFRLSVSSSELKQRLSSRSSFSGFWFADRYSVSWLAKMEALHEPIWRKAGIFKAIKASTCNICRNQSLILSVAEKWCPETKSFVFPWGEATITLEDVMVLLGFSVLGSPLFAPLDSSEMRDAVEKLEKATKVNVSRNQRVTENSWISIFLGSEDMEHEAFLALWLSFYVFPCRTRRRISRHVFPIAVRLARGERIALAPVVLASIYRDLDRISGLCRGKCDGKVNLKSLFKLVQVWTWERFKNTRPKTREIPKGEPRIAQWDYMPQRSTDVRLSYDDFDWRPYTKRLKNWNPLEYYVEEALWLTVDNDNLDDKFVSFARCVRASQLAGDGFVEHYYPHRVAMQFGLAQDLPRLVTRHSNITEKEAWDDYSKSLDGLKLYMPSRHDHGSVTLRYRDWWLKSVSKFLCSIEIQNESTETFSARKTSDDDDDDVSSKVLPLSKVVEKFEEGFTLKRRRSSMRRLAKKDKTSKFSLVSSGWNKRSNYQSMQMKRAHEDNDDDESSMDEEEEEDSLTIAKRRRRRRFQVVDSDDDSEPCQDTASVKIEQRSEEDDDETSSKASKAMEICEDEVDANVNNAEKKIMDDEWTKKAELWLHEVGEKKRCNEKRKEDVLERFKQRKIAIKEIELNLEIRIVKAEKTLAMIGEEITRKIPNQIELSA